MISQDKDNVSLARIENSNWVTNLLTSKIASDALTKLNFVYFKYLSTNGNSLIHQKF